MKRHERVKLMKGQRQNVREFLANRLTENNKASTLIEDLLLAYQESTGVEFLSTDGFGKLVPKKYKRKLLWLGNGIARRGIVGWQLKK